MATVDSFKMPLKFLEWNSDTISNAQQSLSRPRENFLSTQNLSNCSVPLIVESKKLSEEEEIRYVPNDVEVDVVPRLPTILGNHPQKVDLYICDTIFMTNLFSFIIVDIPEIHGRDGYDDDIDGEYCR